MDTYGTRIVITYIVSINTCIKSDLVFGNLVVKNKSKSLFSYSIIILRL